MTTKHRFHNNKYRLEIRERDHNPPHAHLVGGEYDVVIYLGTLQSEGEWPKGLKDEVLLWIKGNYKDFMEEWNKWHK
jgi:hypothetical protein